jgi:uncharacterized protein YndB with AHSA1/START domain
MTTLRGRVTDHLAVDPDALFTLVTAVQRLPEWNAHVRRVVEGPAGLVPGSEWVVEMRAMGTGWNSRSRVVELDPSKRRFVYQSQSDDENPSYALWTWEVLPAGQGTDVTVSYELHPKTFWRTVLLSRIRHHQVQREIQTSLGAAAALLGARPPA